MEASHLDALLQGYEERKQDETRAKIQRALKLEEARRAGNEHMRRVLLGEARDASDRLEHAGHSVIYQEFLDAYPPGARIHLWPKPGPMDVDDPARLTLEFTWGEPEEGRLCVRRWSTEGLGNAVDQGSAGPAELDSLWVREQILTFVRAALSGET